MYWEVFAFELLFVLKLLCYFSLPQCPLIDLPEQELDFTPGDRPSQLSPSAGLCLPLLLPLIL